MAEEVDSVRRGLVIMIAGVLALTFTGCAPKNASRGETTLTAAGSTSVQPFAEILAEDYGSKHPGAAVNVQGGGSSAGVEAAQNGAAEIGMLSRELKGGEKSLHEYVIAYDAIALVIHPTNPVADLTKEQIARIFSGQAINWRELGGPDHLIHVVSREEGSGTRSSFDGMILGTQEVTAWAMVQDSNGAVRETVAGDRFAIGYVSLGLVDHRVKAVAVDGVQPSTQTVKEKKYGIVRPFLFVTKTEPQGLTRQFIDFVLSPAGQTMLQVEGLVPVR